MTYYSQPNKNATDKGRNKWKERKKRKSEEEPNKTGQRATDHKVHVRKIR